MLGISVTWKLHLSWVQSVKAARQLFVVAFTNNTHTAINYYSTLCKFTSQPTAGNKQMEYYQSMVLVPSSSAGINDGFLSNDGHLTPRTAILYIWRLDVIIANSLIDPACASDEFPVHSIIL